MNVNQTFFQDLTPEAQENISGGRAKCKNKKNKKNKKLVRCGTVRPTPVVCGIVPPTPVRCGTVPPTPVRCGTVRPVC